MFPTNRPIDRFVGRFEQSAKQADPSTFDHFSALFDHFLVTFRHFLAILQIPGGKYGAS